VEEPDDPDTFLLLLQEMKVTEIATTHTQNKMFLFIPIAFLSI
jgi:hypothetical protein